MTSADDVIGELAQGLRGPARVRRRLLAETRGGLADAVDRYVDAGLDHAAATRCAVAEFGTPDELMPVFQAELDVSARRRAATVAVLALPPLAWVVNLAWETNPRLGAPPSWITAFGVTLAVVTVAFGLTAAAVLWLTGRVECTGRTARYGMRALRFGGFAGLTVLAAGLVALAAAALPFLLWPPFLVTALLVAAVFALSASQRRLTSAPGSTR